METGVREAAWAADLQPHRTASAPSASPFSEAPRPRAQPSGRWRSPQASPLPAAPPELQRPLTYPPLLFLKPSTALPARSSSERRRLCVPCSRPPSSHLAGPAESQPGRRWAPRPFARGGPGRAPAHSRLPPAAALARPSSPRHGRRRKCRPRCRPGDPPPEAARGLGRRAEPGPGERGAREPGRGAGNGAASQARGAGLAAPGPGGQGRCSHRALAVRTTSLALHACGLCHPWKGAAIYRRHLANTWALRGAVSQPGGTSRRPRFGSWDLGSDLDSPELPFLPLNMETASLSSWSDWVY